MTTVKTAISLPASLFEQAETFNWFPGRAWESMSRGSASAQTMEAEPPDMRYQEEPGNEYNHLGLLYLYLNKPKH